MAKARKTRQQKQIADKRRLSLPPVTYSSAELATLPTLAPSPQTQRTPSVSVTSDYSYVRHDLLRTLGITGMIIAAQIILLFVLT